tara:strand:- start:12415 stop:12600 length:186 start_codon:yes stop_codon:yes gene_type:complete
MSRIPAVRKWQVTSIAGDREYVLAPTKKLARLNFAHDNAWLRAGLLSPSIKSVAPIKEKKR